MGDGTGAKHTGVFPSGARVAIVADESGSLTPEGVEQERLAVISIANADPSPDTQVAIIGFGSTNGAGNTPAEVYCELSPTRDPEDKNRLEACAKRIHSRPPEARHRLRRRHPGRD